ncbi:RidA family protein [Pseudoxanthomonas dokdonensis]|uniref:Aminoacrylate peracid reductase n=1 Tax=Pseudoxanthomonas dokdonensis TaxID=344882 RepID=A0A0R0CG56_9GAMM|nr:RidA family protein [Pseudoxanthomonas dokdonensis]KRG68796.1 aminoacrylate peracid reductase [Pseudoxanthomonas dokdonensis]
MIKRIQPGQRYSAAVIHGNVAYLAGIVADDDSQDVVGQTRQVLQSIDALLATLGTDKRGILKAEIFLHDIARDYDGMNQAWEEWMDKDHLPARATVQAALSTPEELVEIVITAAV